MLGHECIYSALRAAFGLCCARGSEDALHVAASGHSPPHVVEELAYLDDGDRMGQGGCYSCISSSTLFRIDLVGEELSLIIPRGPALALAAIFAFVSLIHFE